MLATVLLAATPAQIPIQPVKIISTFCDNQQDFQTDESGKQVGKLMNYTLCMDVSQKSFLMECSQGMPCPAGPDMAKTVYTGGTSYIVDFEGKCTSHKCANLPNCDPPDGMPFSFLLLDDDSRGVARRIGTAVIAGVAVDQWQHERGPGMVMNWFLRNISTSPDEPKMLFRNSFNHSGAGGPAGLGNRDFHKDWITPVPAGTFAIPKGCTSVDDESHPNALAAFKAWASVFGDN